MTDDEAKAITEIARLKGEVEKYQAHFRDAINAGTIEVRFDAIVKERDTLRAEVERLHDWIKESTDPITALRCESIRLFSRAISAAWAEDVEQATAAVDNAIRAAARMIVNAALDLLQADPHSWSVRPCPTCSPISTLVGRPFGCVLFAQQRTAGKEQA